jgi:hypothetical protein
MEAWAYRAAAARAKPSRGAAPDRSDESAACSELGVQVRAMRTRTKTRASGVKTTTRKNQKAGSGS